MRTNKTRFTGMQHSCTTRRTQPANAIFTAAGVSLFVARFFSVSSWCRASSSSSSPLPPPCAPGFFKEVHSFLFPLCSTFFPLFVFASFSFFLFFFLFSNQGSSEPLLRARVCVYARTSRILPLCLWRAPFHTERRLWKKESNSILVSQFSFSETL